MLEYNLKLRFIVFFENYELNHSKGYEFFEILQSYINEHGLTEELQDQVRFMENGDLKADLSKEMNRLLTGTGLTIDKLRTSSSENIPKMVPDPTWCYEGEPTWYFFASLKGAHIVVQSSGNTQTGHLGVTALLTRNLNVG